VPVVGLDIALPPVRAVACFEAERHPRIRSARRGAPLLSEEDTRVHHRIDPHTGSHTAAVID
jgi:hypothetical protein